MNVVSGQSKTDPEKWRDLTQLPFQQSADSASGIPSALPHHRRHRDGRSSQQPCPENTIRQCLEQIGQLD